MTVVNRGLTPHAGEVPCTPKIATGPNLNATGRTVDQIEAVNLTELDLKPLVGPCHRVVTRAGD